MEIVLIIFAVILVLSLIRIAFRLAWGVIKFLFSLGLFAVCPILFIVLGILGVLGSSWWIVALVGVLCGVGFSRS